MAKNLPTPKGQPEQQQRVGGPTNLAKPKNIARRKKAPVREPVSGIDFDTLTKQANPDAKAATMRSIVQNTPYISLSDLHANVGRGGRPLMEKLEQQIKTESDQGLGVRTWRLRMVVNPDGSAPQPGQIVSWVRQRHNHLDYGHGRKLGNIEAEAMRRRGDEYLLTEEAEVELDDCCCFDVTYKDAGDLLSKYGIYYLTFDPDGDRQYDNPVSNPPLNKRISKAGTYNWRFVEIPPGYEHLAPYQKKTKKRKTSETGKTSETVDPLKDVRQTVETPTDKQPEGVKENKKDVTQTRSTE